MTSEDLERLELKLAYLDRANQELSDVVYRQQQELQELRDRIGLLASKIDALKAAEPAYTAEEEKPPHY